jgi:nucleoside-diphosphate-sugar epimerase
MPLTVENEGRATRDFIFVDDIVRGLMLCASLGRPGEVYNLASGVETSIQELARLVNEQTGNPTPIEYLPPRSWDHSGKRFGSTEKSKTELGFEPRVDLQAGLEQTIDWTRRNLAFIDACIEKHCERLAAVAEQQPASRQRSA